MKHDHDFAERRPLAQHCAELIGRSAQAREPVTRFADVSVDLARALAMPLGGLLGGARVKVTCSDVEALSLEELRERIGPVAANCVLGFHASGAQALVSLALGDLLTLTDRVFGGEGEVAAALPAEIPLTADLVASQLEGLVADAFGIALAPLERPDAAVRSASLKRIDPFEGLETCQVFTLRIAEVGRGDWSILVAVSNESFATLFAAALRKAGPATARDPMRGPFGDMLLPLEAVMAEFSLPLAKLSSLSPGDIFPLALSREVPLKISETTIGYGSVGAAEDRVALQLTRVF